jgi:hypothetical protein
VRIQQFIEPSFGGVSTIFGAVAFVCANGSRDILEGQSHVVNAWGFIPMNMGSSSLSLRLLNEIYYQPIHLTSFWPRFCRVGVCVSNPPPPNMLGWGWAQ